jgi:hypothetical protein
MIFRQLFESLSSTYAYLLGCEEAGRKHLHTPGHTDVHFLYLCGDRLFS